ncbi:MAG TPA: TonB-dependent receptor [Candidatus Sulfotelmatobacter sp.]|nr:TonB-dependent receptor [Candidatus Sulfotelmatobacter sp.]
MNVRTHQWTACWKIVWKFWSVLLCAMVLVWADAGQAQERTTVSGKVEDTTGTAIEGAQIELRTEAGITVGRSDEQGHFRVVGNGAGGTLTVNFPGFATVRREIRPRMSAENLQIVLAPAANLQRIEVKGTGGDRIPAVPTSQYEILSEAIDQSGSLAVDDVLRQVPGFSTFRRSSSFFANPTSQGVSLRGVGASATSRSNVLLDGIPINDAFGGWVYWARIPREAIETMEVANGGASDLYGGGALGGVVNLRTRTGEAAYATGELSYGSMDTPDFSFAAGAPIGRWSVSAAAQTYQTQGYIGVPENQRGAVDTNLASGVLSGLVELSRSLGERGRFFVRGSGFGETGKNGTPLQRNNTTIPELDLGADWRSTEAGNFSARLYGSRELYHQTFSSIAADRNSESLTDVQRSPSQQIGVVGTWSRLFAEKHRVAAGLEAQDVRGHSAETNYHLGVETALVDAGGRQHASGFFAQDAYAFARSWLLTLGGRVDTWNNNTGYQNRTPLPSGTPTNGTFPERAETAFSPRVSLLKSFSHGTALNASVYRGYRAPTLNELYRNFRVGNILTLANPGLTGEHLTGGEAGVSQLMWENRVTLRGNFFWSDISDPVANVTLTNTPALITREKENLGVIQARGIELSGQIQVTARIELAAAYLFVNSTVLSFSANPALVGNFLPQVPQNQFTFQASYAGKKWTAGLQGRFSGNQFDDDQNLLPLGRVFSLDAQVSRNIGRRTSLFFAVQNLTNDRFNTAATPVFLVGPPIFVRGGVRFAWR